MSLPSSTRRRFSWWGFTWQLFLITVLPLSALVLVVAIGSQTPHHDAMRALVGDRDLKAVKAAANSLEQEIMHRASTLQIMARELGEQTDFSRLSLNREEIAATLDGGMTLFSPDGRLIAASQPSAFWSGIKNTLPDYWDELAQQPVVVSFSPPLQSLNENKIYILAGTMTANRNILLGAFSPAFLAQNTIDTLIDSGHMTAQVIARIGTGSEFEVLYRAGPLRSDEHLANHPGIQESLNQESGISYFNTAEGEHVTAYTSINPIGWGLIIEEAWEDIASPNLITTQAAPLVVVPVFLLALLALWFGARRIVRPLQALEKQATELARGNFEAIRKPVGGIEEIGSLQTALVDMAGRLEAAQQSLHSYIGAMTAGIENERRSLARELHDDTIQSLIALNQRIQLAEKISLPPAQKDGVDLQALVQQTITNLRRLIRGLRPIYLEDLGLAASIEMLSRETSQGTGISISFRIQGNERRLDSQIEMSLYRMAQESLSNIVRHSQAQHAWIELVFTPQQLKLEIRDSGKGFVVPENPSEFPKNGHFGLLGLQERAEIIGAGLQIFSRPGEGTRVLIILPEVPPA